MTREEFENHYTAIQPNFEKWPTVQQYEAIENTEKLLGSMKKEAVHMIKSTEFQETRKAWYHSHLGSIDFARQMGLISEERRQQLYKEFNTELKEEK